MPTHFRCFRYLPTGLTALLLSTAWAPAQADLLYTVQPGDRLWSLAERYLRSPALAERLSQLNHIANPQRIAPGTQLRIPSDWLKLESTQVQLLAAGGDTTVAQGSGPARPAVPGQALQAPASLLTGDSGSATLQFADGSRVLVLHNSELQLLQTQQSRLGQASLVELLLRKGSLENQVTPVGDTGGRFQIRTPAAIAAVRGTQFRVSADADMLRTEVISGAVNVANPTGQITAQAAQGSVAHSGQRPSPPTPLLPAPVLDDLPERLEHLPLHWPLPAVAGASGYRSQLADSAEFLATVSDEVSPSPQVRIRPVADGQYVLRVRAIDAAGLEGLTAQTRLVVHTQPAAPLLIDPAPDARLTTARPQFRWTLSDPDWRYRIRIHAEGSTTPLDEQTVATSAQALQDLPPGRYQWQVAAIDPRTGPGPWSHAQAFERSLPGPGVDIPPATDGSLTLRWAAQPHTAHYRLQLARDPDFARLDGDIQTDSPQHPLQQLAPGAHYVRVQSIATDGSTGPWGSTQAFTVPQPRWPWLLLLLPLAGLL